MLNTYLLTLIIFIPLIGAILITTFPTDTEKAKNRVRWTTLITLIIGFLVSLFLWFGFDPEEPGMQFVQRTEWIPGLGIEYYLGVDGLSLLLVMLTTFLGPLVMAGSWTAINQKVKGFCVALLLLQTAMLGAFLALDIFLFYVFWELMLLPLYFIIGIWGGVRRVYAAIKLFVYTMMGSLIMLIAVLYMALTYHTFSILELYEANVPAQEQLWLFGFFALAFAIKVPMFPFHTWLPDAHVEAPTAGSVILAGVLLKMGTYGFMRFAMPLFPEAIPAFSPVICTLAVIGIIYGALVAMVQPDVKKLVAYSSVSHLGYVMIGLFAMNPQGVQGGILQMVNHGVSTGALFLLVGMVYERTHTRMIKDYGGIAKIMPIYAFFFMVITFSSVGLPGTNGFVGEMLILLGAFEQEGMRVFAILAALGVILGAVYMLWMYRRVFFGPVTNEKNLKLADLNIREIAILSILVVFVFWIGLYPATFLEPTERSVALFIERTHTASPEADSGERRPINLRIGDDGDAHRGRGDARGDRARPMPVKGIRPVGHDRTNKRIFKLPPQAAKRLRDGDATNAPPPAPSIRRPGGGDVRVEGGRPAASKAPTNPAAERRAP
jgi:NADH-quinone oxidoreductase subunit M